MTNKERVLASLNHEQPDKTPYNIGFTQKAHQAMAEYYGDPDFCAKLGNCLGWASAGPKQAWVEVEPGIWEDPFGVQWNRTVDKDIGVVCNTRITEDTLDDYTFPDIDAPPSDGDIEAVIAANPENFIVAELGFSLFERAWTLVGMEELLMAMVAEPGFAHQLLDRILEFNLRVVDKACAHDVDAMMFGDDWGMQTGLIMGADRWREFIKPRIAQMYGAVKARGKYVFIHSCGKVDEVFPDLIEVGLDCFNPFQPEVIDAGQIKRAYGDRLSFYGGISTQRTLPYGTVQEVRDEVRRLIDDIGRNGGYIAAPAHATPGDAKAENIAAMIEVLQNQ